MSGLDLNIISSVKDSANVEDCSAVYDEDNDIADPYSQINKGLKSSTLAPYKIQSTGCSSNPCRNEGQCYPISPIEYKCACINGYM